MWLLSTYSICWTQFQYRRIKTNTHHDFYLSEPYIPPLHFTISHRFPNPFSLDPVATFLTGLLVNMTTLSQNEKSLKSAEHLGRDGWGRRDHSTVAPQHTLSLSLCLFLIFSPDPLNSLFITHKDLWSFSNKWQEKCHSALKKNKTDAFTQCSVTFRLGS